MISQIIFGQNKISPKQISLFPDEYSELDDVSFSNQEKDNYLYKILERARIKYLKALSYIEKKDTIKAAEMFEQAIDILNSISNYSIARSNPDYLELVKAILEDFEVHVQSINKLDESSSLYLIRESLNKEIDTAFRNRKVNIGIIQKNNQNISGSMNSSTNFVISLDDNEYVQKSIEFLTQKPIGRKFVKGSLQRSGIWGGFIKRIIQEEDMPQEIFYLAMVESGFNPFAVSKAKAVGIWQFITSTGKLYNLNDGGSVWVDERRDPIKSTRAAMRHLKDLFNQLGDWHLAIAAYNCGINAVERAISRLNQNDTINFWNIIQFLPRETRNYVPLFIAVVKIATNPEAYGFTKEEIKPADEIMFDTYILKEPVSLSALAKCANVSVETLKELNPELIVPFTPPDLSEYEIRIPFGTKNEFISKFIALKPEEKTPFYTYTVGKNETLKQIAEKFNIDIEQILLANNLSLAAKKLRKGTQIRVPILLSKKDSNIENDLPSSFSADKTISTKPSNNIDTRNTTMNLIEEQSNYKSVSNKIVIRYIVKKDETLQTIASKYKVEIDSLLYWNYLISDKIYENQSLRIIVPLENLSKNEIKEELTINSSITEANPFLRNNIKSIKKIHKVKKGETLELIASKYNLSITDLLKWNPHVKQRKKHKILAGEKIVYYSNLAQSSSQQGNSYNVKVHIVRPGDTLSSIARRYGITFNDLIKKNPKIDPDNIKVGQKVYIQ
ncbi:MAG: LysM peptidoglycan-binding domain-containing protein [Candidatus Kapaibacteriales bacterium]